MDDSQVFFTQDEKETQKLGFRLGKACSSKSVVSLRGPLGSGKTIIAKGIARSLGIEEPIVSPTFTIMQEYEGTMALHHMDLYRIDGTEDFDGIGGEELLYADGITVIEWSEKIEEMLPEHTIRVDISIEGDGRRKITIKGVSL